MTTDASMTDANTSDCANAVTDTSMSDRVSHCVDDLGMVSLARVGDLHHSAAIAAVSVVSHVLDPAVRKSHAVLTLEHHQPHKLHQGGASRHKASLVSLAPLYH